MVSVMRKGGATANFWIDLLDLGPSILLHGQISGVQRVMFRWWWWWWWWWISKG